ncbi:lysosomal cholesterol signaling protein-like isoform X2 [Dysidea avara]
MVDGSIANLFPAIGRIFAVVILGYILGKFKFITQQNASAVGVIVGKIALPALLLQNMAILDLSAINWKFMAGILIARSSVFVLVFVITLVFTRPVSMGKPGILAIFCTQSNDFALGLPILSALYGNSVGPGGFHYLSYIYLIAPIQVGLLNPIGFFCMEYALQKSKNKETNSSVSIRALLFKTFWGLISNPIINMTLLGIAINVVMSKMVHGGDSDYESSHNLKDWMKQFLTLLGDAYSACALLYLGICMVGKLNDFNGLLVLKSSLLCATKMILMPLITELILEGLGLDREISTFGFVFGTFPTAPSVFVFAALFHCGTNLVGPALVFCTFLSAPIIYISARMALVRNVKTYDYENVVTNTRTDCSIVSIVSVVVVFCLFIMARRYRSHVHIFVMHLMTAMVVMCSGAIGITYTTDETPWNYFCFTFFLGGVFATRLWSALLSLELVILLVFGPNFTMLRWLLTLAAGWGLPFISTTILVIVVAEGHKGHSTLDKAFYLGDTQLVLSCIFLGISAIITAASLIFIVLRVVRRSRHHVHLDTQFRLTDAAKSLHGASSTMEDSEYKPIITTPTTVQDEQTASNETTSLLATSTDKKPDKELISGGEHVEEQITFADIPMPGLWVKDEAGKNTDRIIILLFILLASMIVGIFAVSYNVSHPSQNTGVYIEVDVLDGVMNYGQGFFLFLLFATEKSWITLIILKRIRRVLYHIENVMIPDKNELDSASFHVCETFKLHHLQSLIRELPSTKSYHLRTFQNVFTGSELVDWLLQRGLVNSREDGVNYGDILLRGQVVEHVLQEHYFHDDDYFYHVKPPS